MNNVEKLDQIKAIITLVMYAVEANELEQVLERIAQASRDLVNARYAALGVPDGHGGLRYFKTAGMTQEEIRRMDHLPEGRGLIGAMMYDRSPLLLENITDDPRSSGFPPGHPPMTQLLSVPIQLGQQLFGVIYLTDREDGLPFDQTDQTMIETMAGYVVGALGTGGMQMTVSFSHSTPSACTSTSFACLITSSPMMCSLSFTISTMSLKISAIISQGYSTMAPNNALSGRV